MKNLKKWISRILVFALLATNSLSHVQLSYANELVNNEESVEATVDNVGANEESVGANAEDVGANEETSRGERLSEPEEEEAVEANEETVESSEESVGANEDPGVGANACGALDEIVEDLNIASISDADAFEVE